MTKLYKEYYGIDLIPTQPLLLVKAKNGNNTNKKYLPPQLCRLVGVSEKMTKKSNLMEEISKLTIQNPNDKVNSINDILKLINKKDGIFEKIIDFIHYFLPNSSSQRKDECEFEIIPNNKSIFGYELTKPVMIGRFNGNFFFI